MADMVGMWEVPLSDGIYQIEFEHGTTTGKRVIYINGKEILRRDWMFKLVGKETFPVGHTGAKATINIEALTGFTYEYTLEINGKSLQTFQDNWAKISKTWLLKLDGADCRIVLGLQSQASSFARCCNTPECPHVLHFLMCVV
ncbi:fas apoptotic inhibitory molecule b isoform X2 [Silurus meridionalis]|uniref:fas apoptotic inhibitory molecule b isoform X2 n=1 Tax=Silurus meridionalis TaxID=175797 RepID=UPI001EE9DD86|nr:fas apoptotic inhibitory molecule b isoform X2 [Silurus meridionalis]